MLLAVAVTDVSGQDRLLIEAEAMEHCDCASLLSHNLHDQLLEVELPRQLESFPDQLTAETPTALLGIHDHLQLSDVR